MKKNSKSKYYVIISILVVIILVLITIILKPTNKNAIKDVVGAYYNSHWNGKEKNIVLFEDMTCQYLSDSRNCEWEIKDKIITITLSSYTYEGNNRVVNLNTEQQCNDYLKKYNINATCERKEEKITDIKVNDDGIVVYTHFFTKIK